MGEVISFKSKDELNNEEFKKSLVEALSAQGYSPEAVAVASEKGMELIKMSKEIVAGGFSCSFVSSMGQEEARRIERELSLAFQSYQKPISEFVSKLIVELTFKYADEIDAGRE